MTLYPEGLIGSLAASKSPQDEHGQVLSPCSWPWGSPSRDAASRSHVCFRKDIENGEGSEKRHKTIKDWKTCHIIKQDGCLSMAEEGLSSPVT